jgi:hypothetical protein
VVEVDTRATRGFVGAALSIAGIVLLVVVPEVPVGFLVFGAMLAVILFVEGYLAVHLWRNPRGEARREDSVEGSPNEAGMRGVGRPARGVLALSETKRDATIRTDTRATL